MGAGERGECRGGRASPLGPARGRLRAKRGAARDPPPIPLTLTAAPAGPKGRKATAGGEAAGGVEVRRRGRGAPFSSGGGDPLGVAPPPPVPVVNLSPSPPLAWMPYVNGSPPLLPPLRLFEAAEPTILHPGEGVR